MVRNRGGIGWKGLGYDKFIPHCISLIVSVFLRFTSNNPQVFDLFRYTQCISAFLHVYSSVAYVTRVSRH